VNTVASGRKVRTLFEVLHLNWQNKSEQRKSRRPRRWSARVKRLLIGINEHFWRATTAPVHLLEATEVEVKRAAQALSAHAKALKMTALTTAEIVSG